MKNAHSGRCAAFNSSAIAFKSSICHSSFSASSLLTLGSLQPGHAEKLPHGSCGQSANRVPRAAAARHKRSPEQASSSADMVAMTSLGRIRLVNGQEALESRELLCNCSNTSGIGLERRSFCLCRRFLTALTARFNQAVHTCLH